MDYKVLWVDDDHSIVEPYQTLADYKDIDLIHADNWEEGKSILLERFDELTAIILDANCKINRDSAIQGNIFLGKATSDLQFIFGERHNSIPWYILSAGTMSKFDTIIECVSADRLNYVEEWGDIVYFKDTIDELEEENPLFENICRVGQNKKHNIILHRHREVFKYLGDKGYLSQEARTNLLGLLSKVYYPEGLKYKDFGNIMRKIIEHMLRHANCFGILPDAFLEKKNTPNLTDSMLFLCGREAKNVGYQLWDNENNKAFSIFSDDEYYEFSTVLNFAQKHSHTSSDMLTKELCYGMALTLCHLILVYGHFIDSLDSVERIQQMWRQIQKPQPKESKSTQPTIHTSTQVFIDHTTEGVVEETGGILHISDVTVGTKYKKFVGSDTVFRIEKVLANTGITKDLYPYFAPNGNIKEKV